MNKNRIILLSVTVILISSGSGGMTYSDPMTSQENSYPKQAILVKLGSDNWEERREGVVSITEELLQDKEIRDSLVKLLEKEIAFRKVEGGLGDFPWEYWAESYWMHLVVLVAGMREERALPVIVQTLEWSYSKKVGESLAEMGDPAVKYLIESLQDEKRFSGTLRYLNTVLKGGGQSGRTISDSTRRLVKEHMLEFSKSNDVVKRRLSVQVLGRFKDPDVVAHLRQIAETDPHSYIKEIDGVRKKVFPIREEAERQLKLMENQ